LRHYCASYLLNGLELPPQDVAQQLGHTDGGVLVQTLYGHPNEKLARERIKLAFASADQPLRAIGPSASPSATEAQGGS
jgi:integrase